MPTNVMLTDRTNSYTVQDNLFIDGHYFLTRSQSKSVFRSFTTRHCLALFTKIQTTSSICISKLIDTYKISFIDFHVVLTIFGKMENVKVNILVN